MHKRIIITHKKEFIVICEKIFRALLKKMHTRFEHLLQPIVPIPFDIYNKRFGRPCITFLQRYDETCTEEYEIANSPIVD